MQHEHDTMIIPAADLIEHLWLAHPERWQAGEQFNPWVHDRAMAMAGDRPLGLLPAAMVVKR